MSLKSRPSVIPCSLPKPTGIPKLRFRVPLVSGKLAIPGSLVSISGNTKTLAKAASIAQLRLDVHLVGSQPEILCCLRQIPARLHRHRKSILRLDIATIGGQAIKLWKSGFDVDANVRQLCHTLSRMQGQHTWLCYESPAVSLHDSADTFHTIAAAKKLSGNRREGILRNVGAQIQLASREGKPPKADDNVPETQEDIARVLDRDCSLDVENSSVTRFNRGSRRNCDRLLAIGKNSDNLELGISSLRKTGKNGSQKISPGVVAANLK
jgi:hypothetical protein